MHNPIIRIVLLLALVACEAAPELPAPPTYSPAALANLRLKAVLIAGDGNLPVFDNAVGQLASRLRRDGVATAELSRLSARPPTKTETRAATLDQIADTIGELKPTDGQGCLVFVTSHGLRDRGIELSRLYEVLSPRWLDRTLASGCGNAPTVVIASACYSGDFAAPPMARPNRIILTAARADRPSFGCRAGRTYTVFDQCLLAALDQGGTWQEVYQATRTCVAHNEQRLNVRQPSEPQAYFGAAVEALPAPRPHQP